MEDTARNDQAALEVAQFIEEHRGKDTLALYVGGRCSFADHFVIATGTSAGHMRGLAKNLLDYLDERGMPVLNRRKVIDDEGWVLLDCQTLVIHIFNEEKRKFYDLERLWFDGEPIYSSLSSSS
jgi:ribosome-associated protein